MPEESESPAAQSAQHNPTVDVKVVDHFIKLVKLEGGITPSVRAAIVDLLGATASPSRSQILSALRHTNAD